MQTTDRYDSIKHLKGAAFCAARNKMHKTQLIDDVDPKTLKPSQSIYTCKNCSLKFIAKKADRQRGWAKFCSKSCKAQKK